MDLTADRKNRNFAIHAALFLLLAVYIFVVLRRTVAAGLATSVNSAVLEKAVRLQPSEAAYHDRAGRLLFFVDANWEKAAAEYREAVRLNPHESGYWLDLALAYSSLGLNDKERECLENARAVNPKDPDVLWELANLALVEGDQKQAFAIFRELIANVRGVWPPMDTRAIQQAWKTSGSVQQMENEVLPPLPQEHLIFITMLADQGRTAELVEALHAAARLPQPLPYSDSAMHVIEVLSRAGRVEEATALWNRIVPANLRKDGTELVTNPGFEEHLLAGGYHWQFASGPAVSGQITDWEHAGGLFSAEITFASNTNDSAIQQIVPVAAKAKYQLRFQSKSRDLQAADFPEVTVREFPGGGVLASAPFSHAAHWTASSLVFNTLPSTHAVLLEVGSHHFGTAIKGVGYVDDVSISKATE